MQATADIFPTVSPSRPARGVRGGSCEAEGLRWISLLAKAMGKGFSTNRLSSAFRDVVSLFEGSFPGYRACDTRYHSLEHTMLLLPPFCRIAMGLVERNPSTIFPGDVELGLVAVLLHDSGYIRRQQDRHGTGGKYTFRHIDRSVAFAKAYLPSLGYSAGEIQGVEQMIRCTGVKAELEQVHFSSEAYRLLGYDLGTSDLLAQMADPHYLEKLPFLFLEFQEAYSFEGPEWLKQQGIEPFESALDLIQKTPIFYRHVVLKRLEAMGSLHRLLDEQQSGRNPYIETIEAHLQKIAVHFGQGGHRG